MKMKIRLNNLFANLKDLTHNSFFKLEFVMDFYPEKPQKCKPFNVISFGTNHISQVITITANLNQLK